jgi:Arc/MetJ family transcription regulator
VVALLLIIQFHERWPPAEAIDDRLAAATARHTSLKLDTAQVCAVFDPLTTLARLAGVLFLGEQGGMATTIRGSSCLLFL